MEKQIPKIIHYCWFGGNPLPDLAKKCIASWRKYLPDYEIKEWNETNFDVYQIPYVAEAYKLKCYAHVSDYARFWILYHYGGVYFDTDVEVIKPLDDIIARGSYAGFECQEGTSFDNPNGNMNPGLGMAICKGHPFIAKMLDYYKGHHYIRWNGRNTGNITLQVTKFLDYDHKEVLEDGIISVSGLYIYPIEYFCPLNYYTGEMHITEHTHTIHHYLASWLKKGNRLQGIIQRVKYILTRIRCMFIYYNK
jgi:hypothetical protein